jgi:hypothetical protein
VAGFSDPVGTLEVEWESPEIVDYGSIAENTFGGNWNPPFNPSGPSPPGLSGHGFSIPSD